MKILIDTNVLIDYISVREPYYDTAKAIFSLCADGSINGVISALSVMNTLYITRKAYSMKQQKEILLSVCDIVDVIGVDRKHMISILENDDFSDTEDCFQMKCAEISYSDLIVTRNINDYKYSSVQAITPDEFIKLYDRTRNF